MISVYFTTLCYIGLSTASERAMLKKYVDPLADGTILKEFVFTNAHKNWNNYVQKLIQFTTKKIFSQRKQTIKIYLQYFVKLLKQFINKSKHVNILHVDPYFDSDDEIHETILLQPLMTYRPSDLAIIPLDVSPLLRDIQVKQHFFLSPYLQLNISVHYIYFSSNSFLKCYFGSLIIESIAHNSAKYPYNTKYKYCGIIPSFTLYPASNKITIAISTEPIRVTFDTIISYSVIDSKRIISYEMTRAKSVRPVTVMKLLSIDSYLLKYHLEVEKYERLNILCNFSQHYFIQVYDGPGTLYNILQPYKEKGKMVYYTTTTFQSVIFLLTREIKIDYSILIAYNATISTKLQKEAYLQKNNSIFVISEIEIRDSEIRMIKLETEAHLFFKITINKMKYTGIKYFSCGFAGITLYDINRNGSFQKISTVCYNNEQEYRYRNLYTQNSLMLLVLYSYKSYSNMSLNLSVSTSECKATTINICALKHDDLNLASTSFFSIRKEKCIILQLDYRQANISLFKMDRSENLLWTEWLMFKLQYLREPYLRRKYKITFIITIVIIVE